MMVSFQRYFSISFIELLNLNITPVPVGGAHASVLCFHNLTLHLPLLEEATGGEKHVYLDARSWHVARCQ